jgi:hypothetical protein
MGKAERAELVKDPGVYISGPRHEAVAGHRCAALKQILCKKTGGVSTKKNPRFEADGSRLCRDVELVHSGLAEVRCSGVVLKGPRRWYKKVA